MPYETKLLTDPNVKKDFLAALSQGAPIRVACMYARISDETYSNYRKRANNGEPEFIAFIQEVDRLLAEVQIKLLSEINNGKTSKDENGEIIKDVKGHPIYEPDNLWTRKAWILERRFRKDWGRDIPDSEEKQDKVIVVLPSEYKTSEEWERLNNKA